MSVQQHFTGKTNGALSSSTQAHGRCWVAIVWCCAILLGMSAAITFGVHFASKKGPQLHPSGLQELLTLDPNRLARVPLLELNLLCAKELCPTNEPDVTASAATLQDWATHICSETQRHQYRFERNPGEFENSAGFFRMLMLSVVLDEDYGIHYDEQRRAGPDATQGDDRFFSDASAVFLHGLLGPERKGTCSSLPVLYVAVGRQLGYPLKLVTTRGHLFVRWEGLGERFNVEATAWGLSRFDDEYYRHWPFEISPAEESAEGYLKSLTVSQELAVFLSIRGMCLRDQGKLPEAAETFTAAARLDPGCRSYGHMLASLETTLTRQPKAVLRIPPETIGQSAHN